MTAFSLFHRPSFERKLSAISSQLQLQALIAAISSFSARFNYSSLGNLPKIPSHLHFRNIASQSVDEALKQCSDDTPPLCLLQALILITFEELIRGVRGRAWSLVGECVHIAYELQLHLVDKETPDAISRPTSLILWLKKNDVLGGSSGSLMFSQVRSGVCRQLSTVP